MPKQKARNEVHVVVTDESGKTLKRAILVERGPMAKHRTPQHLAQAVIDGLYEIDPDYVKVQSTE